MKERGRSNISTAIGGAAIGAIGGAGAWIYSESAYIEKPSDGWKIVGTLLPIICAAAGLAVSEYGNRRRMRRKLKTQRRAQQSMNR
jgi:hypothetical protein